MTPALSPVSDCTYRIAGHLGVSLAKVTDNWLLVAPEANPAMLEMFADRDVRPYRDMVPWAGEFAGKYLTAAVQIWRVTGDPRLAAHLCDFVPRLIGHQARDGYLGPWPRDARLTNFSRHHGETGLRTWDTWGHYHIMLGLLAWHEATGDGAALACVRRIADLICRKYLGPKVPRLVETGSTEMNLAPVHALAMLYRRTRVDRYLAMAEQLVGEFGAMQEGRPLAGNYLNAALAGQAFFEMPKPRWESLHSIMGLAELYWITGEERYRTAFERIWWDIAEHDRHNNGGFSSGEQATGNPFDPRPIETCCTIAWLALSVELLKLTGDSRAADELELSTLNSVLGLLSRSGRWATYNTPSDGVRCASVHQIVFQARPGSPELNCCSVNAPRGLGLLSEWAVMQGDGGVYLNLYGPSEMKVPLRSGPHGLSPELRRGQAQGTAPTSCGPHGLWVAFRQETDYPLSGRIRLSLYPSAPAEFALNLRVPVWSYATQININGETQARATPGAYLTLRRCWQSGDTVTIDLDMSLRFWHGERECQGLVSVYCGPLLLAYDRRYNRGAAAGRQARPYGGDPWHPVSETALSVEGLRPQPMLAALQVPTLDTRRLAVERVAWDDWLPPALLLRTVGAGHRDVYLCDYASAGQTGSLYRSWLPARRVL